jgi:hypothetical protein
MVAYSVGVGGGVSKLNIFCTIEMKIHIIEYNMNFLFWRWDGCR